MGSIGVRLLPCVFFAMGLSFFSFVSAQTTASSRTITVYKTPT
jgi:hypothetical protein